MQEDNVNNQDQEIIEQDKKFKEYLAAQYRRLSTLLEANELKKKSLVKRDRENWDFAPEEIRVIVRYCSYKYSTLLSDLQISQRTFQRYLSDDRLPREVIQSIAAKLNIKTPHELLKYYKGIPENFKLRLKRDRRLPPDWFEPVHIAPEIGRIAERLNQYQELVSVGFKIREARIEAFKLEGNKIFLDD